MFNTSPFNFRVIQRLIRLELKLKLKLKFSDAKLDEGMFRRFVKIIVVNLRLDRSV